MKTAAFSLAGLFAATAALAGPVVKRCSPFDTFPTLDANSSAISYSSGWTFLTNQSSRDRDGVEAFSGAGTASYNLQSAIPWGTFTIYAGKKADRGYQDVYVNDDYVGTGDAYDSQCKSNCPSQVVFSYELPEGKYPEGSRITVRNREYDSRLLQTPYIDLNYVQFVGGNC